MRHKSAKAKEEERERDIRHRTSLSIILPFTFSIALYTDVVSIVSYMMLTTPQHFGPAESGKRVKIKSPRQHTTRRNSCNEHELYLQQPQVSEAEQKKKESNYSLYGLVKFID